MCKKFLQTSAVIGIISSAVVLLTAPNVEAAASLCICTGTYLGNVAHAATCGGAAGCAAACGTTVLNTPIVAQTINCPNSCGDMQGKLCY
ncbi:MAG: hypothetical protein HYX35_02890 [Proteobacteria bacterium]|nr:hypothetical protein [Pseudomonadota bacterium]